MSGKAIHNGTHADVLRIFRERLEAAVADHFHGDAAALSVDDLKQLTDETIRSLETDGLIESPQQRAERILSEAGFSLGSRSVSSSDGTPIAFAVDGDGSELEHRPAYRPNSMPVLKVEGAFVSRGNLPNFDKPYEGAPCLNQRCSGHFEKVNDYFVCDSCALGAPEDDERRSR